VIYVYRIGTYRQTCLSLLCVYDLFMNISRILRVNSLASRYKYCDVYSVCRNKLRTFTLLQTIYMVKQRVWSKFIPTRQLQWTGNMNVVYLIGFGPFFKLIHCIHQSKGREAERQIPLRKWYWYRLRAQVRRWNHWRRHPSLGSNLNAMAGHR